MNIYSKQRKPQYLKFIVVDVVCILIAFSLGYYCRHVSFKSMIDYVIYPQTLFVMVLVHIFATYLMDLYADIGERGYLRELTVVVKQNAFMMFAFLVFVFMTQQGEDFSRLTYVYFFFINIVLMSTVRELFKSIFRKIYQNLQLVQGLYLITTSDQVAGIAHRLTTERLTEYEIKGIVVMDCDMTGREVSGIPVVAKEADMYEFLQLSVVDGVLIHLPGVVEKTHSLAEIFVSMGITVHINMENHLFGLPNRTIHELGNLAVVSSCIKVATPAQIFLKRIIDIAGSLIGLVLAGMALIIMGPIIYLESPGTVFFKQQRVGRNGRKFTIHKFRSMYMDAEERKKELLSQNKMKGHMFKIDNDPRITRIGGFIRKTSIDELPQFWNVFKGEMSLVGTRPPTVDEYNQYEPHHKSRLSMKPGLTGIWQVSGRSSVVDFEEVVRMDTEYINEWSIGLDVKLIFKTISLLFGDRNAR